MARLRALAATNKVAKMELQRALAKFYFRTDLVTSYRQNGTAKYKQSHNHLVQMYHKMHPTLINYSLSPYIAQIGHIEVPKPILTGRAKKFYEDEEEYTSIEKPKEKKEEEKEENEENENEEENEEDPEKAPTLDKL